MFFFNCLSTAITDQLKSSKSFNDNYNIIKIPLYDYLKGYKYENEIDIIENHKKKIYNADILILQSLRTDRGFLNKENIIKYTKSNCKVICIPHYSFSGYFPNFDIINCNNLNIEKNFEENNKYLSNILFDNKKDILLNLDNELEHIKNLDLLSDIKCYNFIKENYRKKRLFINRSYGTNYFYNFLANEIIKKINLDIGYINTAYSNFAKYLEIPIYDNVYKNLELDFDNNFTLPLKCNIVEYTICSKIMNYNNVDTRKKYKKFIIKLNDVIESKKYSKFI